MYAGNYPFKTKIFFSRETSKTNSPIILTLLSLILSPFNAFLFILLTFVYVHFQAVLHIRVQRVHCTLHIHSPIILSSSLYSPHIYQLCFELFPILHIDVYTYFRDDFLIFLSSAEKIK
jgi:hypothetical protein